MTSVVIKNLSPAHGCFEKMNCSRLTNFVEIAPHALGVTGPSAVSRGFREGGRSSDGVVGSEQPPGTCLSYLSAWDLG